MRHLITALLLFVVTLDCNSQEVFNAIMSKAKSNIDSQLDDGIIKQINLFKIDALNYLLIKMREQMPDSTTHFLNQQAYCMNIFVDTYLQMLVTSKDKEIDEQVKNIKLFMDASYSNPLFNDEDTVLVHSYYTNPSSIIRFSLDTDWRKAKMAIYNFALR